MLWVGASAFAVALAIASYLLRVVGITVGYHRYLAHRSFRCGRGVQLALAFLGNAAAQRGPLWWAAHHRHHHRHSDTESDHHSPLTRGFWWSHLGWIFARGSYRTRRELIRDFARYPELRALDRFDYLAPTLWALGCFAIGSWVGARWPASGTDGWQALVWGFAVSTVVLYHATFSINSLVHLFGRRRYATRDASGNIGWLAPLTFGESWHNNHHHFPASARLGFFWWQVDFGWYTLRLLASVGLVRELKVVPDHVRRSVSAPRRAGAA